MSDLPDWTRAVAVEVNAESPTEYWLAKNGTRVMVSNNVTNGEQAMYTVPTGKTLYVLFAETAAYATAADQEAIMHILCEEECVILYTGMHIAGEFVHLTGKMLLRVTAGETINLHADTNATIYGYFVGYLMEEA